MELTLFISQSLLKTLPMTEADAEEAANQKEAAKTAANQKETREETKQHQRLVKNRLR